MDAGASDGGLAGETLRHVVQLPSAPFGACVAPVAAASPAPGIAPLVAQELELAEASHRAVVAALAVFEQMATGNESEATFGPAPWGTGFRVGRVRRPRQDQPVWTFEVLVGPSADPGAMTRVVHGERRGAVGPGSEVELLFDRRAERPVANAVGVASADGRAVLKFVTDATGAWASAAAVLADWRESASASPRSSRVFCDVQLGAEGLRAGRASTHRDLDADGWQDRFAGAAAWISGIGGVGQAEVGAGARPGSSATLAECWGSDGARLFRTASEGGNTVVDPVGASQSRCPPPFTGGPLPRAPAAADAAFDLLSRAWDGLHAPLTFPSRPHRVLWVGAHPDDESYYAAPLLGHLCRDLGGTCTLLVVTDGSTGSCRVPAGCPPDLGTFRRAEMVQAAAVYGARLEQLSWPPGEYPSETRLDLTRWATAAGGGEQLLTALTRTLDATDPEVVITFDPRHGGSCHAEHRVVAALTLEALRRSGRSPLVLMSEGYSPPPRFHDERLLAFDATLPSATTGSDTWAFVGLGLAQHPSQVTPGELSGYRTLRAELRRAYFLRGELVADSRYQICANP